MELLAVRDPPCLPSTKRREAKVELLTFRQLQIHGGDSRDNSFAEAALTV